MCVFICSHFGLRLWASVLLFSQGIAVRRVFLLWQLRNTFASRKRGEAYRRSAAQGISNHDALNRQQSRALFGQNAYSRQFRFGQCHAAWRANNCVLQYTHTYPCIRMEKSGSTCRTISTTSFWLKAAELRKLMVTVAATTELNEEKKCGVGRGNRVPSNCWQLLCMSQKVIIK